MKIPILMYHQIDAPPKRGTPLRGLVVSPDTFKRQMWMLRLLGYRGLSMRDLEPYLLGKQTGKVVGITLDDGYQNNLTNALPVLKKHRFTATCYGVSSMIGGTNTWDEELVASKPLMTLKEWETWRDAGMDIGSHTRAHLDLNTLNAEEASAQIADSKIELETALKCEVRHFCYPYGRYTEAHTKMVRDAGYVSATTTRRGRAVPNLELWELRRVLVARATSPLQFLAKVCTAYEDRRG